MEKKKQVNFELHRTARLIKRYLDNNCHKSYVDNLTGNHGYIIGFLYDNRDRDIFQRDLEREFNIRGSTVTNTLKLMEKNGLIERRSVAGDARLKKICLTAKAMEVHQLMVSDFDQLERTVSKDITEDELAVFFGVLEKINSNIKEASADD